MKTIGRTLVTLTGALVIAAPASAAAAAEAAPAPAASAPVTAAAPRLFGGHCEGQRAVRCAWVSLDGARNLAAGVGSLRDRTAGRDRVAIQVFLQRWTGRRWLTIARTPRFAGFESIAARTPQVRCRNRTTYRTQVNWNWNNGQGRGAVRSRNVTVLRGC